MAPDASDAQSTRSVDEARRKWVDAVREVVNDAEGTPYSNKSKGIDNWLTELARPYDLTYTKSQTVSTAILWSFVAASTLISPILPVGLGGALLGLEWGGRHPATRIGHSLNSVYAAGLDELRAAKEPKTSAVDNAVQLVSHLFEGRNDVRKQVVKDRRDSKWKLIAWAVLTPVAIAAFVASGVALLPVAPIAFLLPAAGLYNCASNAYRIRNLDRMLGSVHLGHDLDASPQIIREAIAERDLDRLTWLLDTTDGWLANFVDCTRAAELLEEPNFGPRRARELPLWIAIEDTVVAARDVFSEAEATQTRLVHEGDALAREATTTNDRSAGFETAL